ncbi:MAG: type VI secretion system baseplate subunit TssG [Bryobacteraceae bacterium]
MGTPIGPQGPGVDDNSLPESTGVQAELQAVERPRPAADHPREAFDDRMAELARRLRNDPWAFEFFEAVWALEEIFPNRSKVGTFGDPAKEAVRFGMNPSLGFPPSDIQALQAGEGPWRMTVNVLGLTGSSGVLPHFYSELVAERDRKKDGTLRDFLDLFHHRLLSLFYRAWKKPRLPVRYSDARMTAYMESLVGLNSPSLRDRQNVDDDTMLYYAGLLGPESRSAVALEQMIGDYFGVAAEVIQFVGAWYELAPNEMCRFENEFDESAELGSGTVVGDAVWDQQSRVRVRLGPLTMEQYRQFLPGETGYERLRTITRFFSRDQYDFELQLVLRRDDVPQCELEDNDSIQLGWTTWMKVKPEFSRHPDDTVMMLQ